MYFLCGKECMSAGVRRVSCVFITKTWPAEKSGAQQVQTDTGKPGGNSPNFTGKGGEGGGELRTRMAKWSEDIS
jgi:hypothetical protein